MHVFAVQKRNKCWNTKQNWNDATFLGTHNDFYFANLKIKVNEIGASK